MLYKNWCEIGYYETSDHGLISFPVRSGKSLKKIELDILRFLAENGSVSPYDMAKGIRLPIKKRPGRKAGKSPPRREKGLGYYNSQIHRKLEPLEKKRLIEVNEVRKDPKRFELKITFDGLLVYLKAWKTLDEKSRNSIKEAIKRYPDHFPFSKYWEEIVEIIGAETAYSSLVQTAKEIAGQLIGFYVKSLELKFEAFVNSGALIGRQKTRAEQNEKFHTFLKECNELKDIYISYIILEDIVLFITRGIEDQWMSKKTLRLLEDTEVTSKLSSKRLKLMPKFAGINYVFTGMLMDKLLWKKLEQEETRPLERNGFAISL